MHGFKAVFKREVFGLFQSPAIYFYVFCLVFVNVLFAFNVGQMLEIYDIGMIAYFQFHPWLFLVFVSALGMRAFCDDNRTGLSELLLALPINSAAVVLGKFFALVTICFISVLFFVPLWIAMNLLTDLDNGIVISSVFASLLLSSMLLSISVFVSVHNKNQTLSFIISATLALFIIGLSMPFFLSGIESLGDFGHFLAKGLSALSIYDGFESAIEGNLRIDWVIINLGLVVFFLTLAANGLENKRSGRL